MKNQLEISTARLLLKSITPSFINEFFDSKSKDEIVAYFGFDEAGYEHFKRCMKKEWKPIASPYFSSYWCSKKPMNLSENAVFILGINYIGALNFLQYKNDKDKQQGYMTEALQAVLGFGFTTLNLHRIEALIAAENVPSLKLLLRNGFTREGVMREDYSVNGKTKILFVILF